jgi:hypothetical protein
MIIKYFRALNKLVKKYRTTNYTPQLKKVNLALIRKVNYPKNKNKWHFLMINKHHRSVN